MTRALRWGRRGLLALAILAALAWWLVPVMVKRLGEAKGSDALGRVVTIGAVHFDPLTLALVLDDVAVAGSRPGAPPVLAVARVEANLEWRSLWHGAPVLRDLVLEAPHLRVARVAEGRFDVDDILGRLAKRPPAPADAPPARFALYNIRVDGGEVDVDDRVVRRTHRLEQLTIGVPFLSNLPSDLDVHVQPTLRFVLDGARYDSLAEGAPFRRSPAGTLELHTGAVDLAAWLPYWPASLGWRPVRGRVTLDARLRFDLPAQGARRLSMAGELGMDDFALAEADGRPLVGWRRLAVKVADLRPLERQAVVQRVFLDGLDLTAERDAAGRLNFLRAMQAETADAAGGDARPDPAAARPAGPDATWRVRVDAVDLDGARLAWRDARVAPAAAYLLADTEVRLANVRWPLPPGPPAAASAASSATAVDAIQVHVQTRFDGSATAAPPASSPARAARSPAAAGSTPSAAGRVVLEGRVGALRSELQLDVDQLPLGPLRPYLAAWWVPTTEGNASAALRARWPGPLAEVGPQIEVSRFAIDDLRLHEPGRAAPAVTWRHAAIASVTVDSDARRVVVGSIELARPEVRLERDTAGASNVSRWMRADAATVPAPAPSAPAAAPPAAPWHARIDRVAVADGRVHWRDQPPAGPVAIDLEGLQVSARDLAWPPAAHATSAVTLAARILPGDRANSATAGRIEIDGDVGLEPLAWKLRVRAERLPVHAVDAYLSAASPLQLLHADLGWHGGAQGTVGPQGLRARAKGDLLLTDLRARARYAADPAAAANAEDLLSWQSLSARATEVTLAPGSAPVVDVGGVKIVDAYARLAVTEQGRFNLTDLTPPSDTAAIPLVAGTPPPAASGATPSTVKAETGGRPAPMPAPAPEQATAEPALAPDIRIGGIEWANARVEYTDRFVRPNYSTDLSALNGSLGAFRTRDPGQAALRLDGRIAGTGVLEVSGSVNPLARPLALDVRARATDIELAALSPYAGKYAGYAIERGKLSMDVRYKVQPDGRLEAGNQVILNQLTFGEKVDSPTATRLPVLFAVALLKDRNGVIDVNLPISGSVNEPDFSVGGIIVKVIVNLITKAVMAPFSLFSGGGGPELNQVLFVPGTARPEAGADSTLDKVAKALQDRPALQLTITGLADSDQEHADLQAANLESRLLALRRSESQQAGASDAGVPGPMSAEDRGRLVKRLYQDTRLPGKPRNLLGLAKELPQAEMESRLAAGLPLPDDAVRQLAIQRALAVRDALAGRGLPNDRMFVASPRLHGAGAAEPEAWLPHAQLALSAR